MQGCNKWSAMLLFRVHLAQLGLHTIRQDFVIGAVIFSSKISLGERAFLPLCCPFSEKLTFLKAL